MAKNEVIPGTPSLFCRALSKIYPVQYNQLFILRYTTSKSLRDGAFKVIEVLRG